MVDVHAIGSPSLDPVGRSGEDEPPDVLVP